MSNGGDGRDFMSGGRDDDTQNGGGGVDKIFANHGRDVSYGGNGHDVLWALSRKDVTAIGDTEGDELSGGEGRDRFQVRDGEVDVVHCGAGRDTRHRRPVRPGRRRLRARVSAPRRHVAREQVEDGEENSDARSPLGATQASG